jgi:hypothetical protein
MLREIAAQVRQRNKVYSEWGFAKKNLRGLGISACLRVRAEPGRPWHLKVLANELSIGSLPDRPE